jgi:molybdenum cofactor biosynthesis protein B
MVDFQSRDTTRGLSSDDDDDSEEGAEQSEADAEAAESDETQAAETEADEVDTTDADTAATGETDPVVTDGEESTADEAEVEDHGHEEHDHEYSHDGHSHEENDHDHGHEHSHDDDHGHSHDDHHHADVEHLGVAVVTVSSSRSLDDDPSGDAAQELVEDKGHSVVARDLVADDLDGVQRAVLALTGREDVDVVVTTGGTGVTPDDVTVEAVEPLFDKHLPGFGELFRILSYEEIGTRAMGSRATGGVSEGVPVFCLPGSEDAVRTAVDELILAEAPHLVGLASAD